MEDTPKYGPLLTRQDVHELCARVRELLRERHELQEEVSELRETLGMFAVLRDLMANDSRALAHVASNGHIALRRVDGASEGAITLQVMAGDPDDGFDNRLHDDQGAEDLGATGPDNTIGNGPRVEDTNPDDNPTDGDSDALQAEEDAGAISLMEAISDRASAAILHADDPYDDYVQADTVEAAEDASAISAPTPTDHDALVSSGVPRPVPRPAPDNAMAPVEAASTAAPSPPVKAGGKAPLPGTLTARILDLIAQSVRPKRPWQVQRELGLPRPPSAELSKLVSRGYLVRVREGCYGIPGRDYGGGVVAESDNA